MEALPGSFDASGGLVVSAPGWAPVASAVLGIPVESGRGEAAITIGIDASLPPEGYRLEVRGDGIRIDGADDAGIFYALQTVRQLRRTDGAVPAVRIEDAPRFPYRGLHLDVGRHFFPVDVVKRYLDHMAGLKLNTFHWHLTEDQGWRIQILRYPRLTEVGSCRAETVVEKNYDPFVGDGTPHCGFYTQDQVRDVVAYAAERHITVIPEIEMPGHSMAALAAYPELACTDGPYEVSTTWGIHSDILCPKEETFTFLEGVLTEVMDLFPSRYIHIGGDEAPRIRWEESDAAQAVIRREGLADEHELQSWFIRRIETFLNANGRLIIGWDEILEGGLAPNATVMSWRGTEGGIAAARQGHDVIMAPSRHLYFDFYQGPQGGEPMASDWSGHALPIEDVYAFDPMPAELTPDEAMHVLGAQANLWTEFIATEDHLEYMLFPRVLALAEMVWTPAERRSWDDFALRLPERIRALRASGVNVRVPEVMR
jgi:hexosaminidase